MTVAGDRIAERVASLAFSEPEAAVDLGDDPSIVGVLRKERVLGLGVHAVESGLATGTPEVLAELDRRHEEAMHQSMQIEVTAVRASRVLSEVGIDHRMLKGVALAHTLYSDPSLRSFRDVDILVPGAQIDRAVDELTKLGAMRPQPQLREGYDARFAKSVTLRLDTVEIDVHRLLAPGPFGVWSRPGELFLLRRHYDVAGETLATLDPTDHLVHACYHVALGQVTPALVNLLDVALLATSVDNPIDFERFLETVERWRGAAVIKRAVRLVYARVDVELPEELDAFRHQAVPRNELEMITPYLTDDPAGRFASLAPATLKALPMSDRAAYALAVGLPDGADPKARVRGLVKRAKQLRG